MSGKYSDWFFDWLIDKLINWLHSRLILCLHILSQDKKILQTSHKHSNRTILCLLYSFCLFVLYLYSVVLIREWGFVQIGVGSVKRAHFPPLLTFISFFEVIFKFFLMLCVLYILHNCSFSRPEHKGVCTFYGWIQVFMYVRDHLMWRQILKENIYKLWCYCLMK